MKTNRFGNMGMNRVVDMNKNAINVSDGKKEEEKKEKKKRKNRAPLLVVLNCLVSRGADWKGNEYKNRNEYGVNEKNGNTGKRIRE